MNPPLPFARRLRGLLILGRVSNLPTVWTNVAVGWWLSGAPLGSALFWRWQIAASLFYTAGMYWNDAFDARWDRANAPERPIPSGLFRDRDVWLLGALQWILAMALLWPQHPISWALAGALTGAILFYDGVHKKVSWAPWIMAACRVFLILLAATSQGTSPTGPAIAAALGTGGYIVGLTYLARRERDAGLGSLWPLLFLMAPLAFALGASLPQWTPLAALPVGAFVGWTISRIRPLFVEEKPSIGRAVAGLLAGLTLVDAVALAWAPLPVLVAIAAAFFACLALQRWIPAT